MQRLLWIELPELNETQKLKGLSQNTTGLIFNPGIFEFDAMRQAFFKRQAKTFFETEEEQQAYITYTEKQYLEATINLKESYFKASQTQPKLTYQEKKTQVQAEFMEVMRNHRMTLDLDNMTQAEFDKQMAEWFEFSKVNCSSVQFTKQTNTTY